MGQAVFRITDGTAAGTIDLVGGPLYIKSWAPIIPAYKGDGVYIDSPLSDGRRLAFFRRQNPIERVDFAQRRLSGDAGDKELAKLVNLLDKAATHWTSNGKKGAVWLEVKSPKHTYTSYAKIVSGQLSGLANRFSIPYVQQDDCTIVDPELVMLLERKPFNPVAPGSSESLPLTGNEQVVEVMYDQSFEEPLVFRAWTLYGSNYTLSYKTTPAIHGNYSVYLTAASGTGPGYYQSLYGLEPSSTITVTVYAKVDTGTAKLTVYDGNGTFTGGSSDTSTASTWTQLSVSKTVPASGSIDVSLELNATGNSAYFDYASAKVVTGTPSTATTDKIYLANGRGEHVINRLHIVDGGVIGSNLAYSTPSFNILPASPAVNDYLLVGVSGILGGGGFNNVVFNLSVAADVTIAWEYLDNGASWSALNVIDGTESFSQTGVKVVSFDAPADWDRFGQADASIGLGAYIRARVTAVGSAGAATQATFVPYNVADSYVEIPSTNMVGDSSPEVDLLLTNESSVPQPRDTFYVPSGANDGEWDASFPPADVTSSTATIAQDIQIAVRYTGVDIPQGAKIVSAKIIAISAGGANNGTVSQRIYIEDSDDAAAFISTTDVPGGRTFVGDSVGWVLPGDDWVDNSGDRFPTPSLVSLVQAVVDRPGWVAGNAMLFMIADYVSVATSTRSVYMYEGDTEAWALDIEWVERNAYVSDVLIGARSVSRGADFHSCLNITQYPRDTIQWKEGSNASFAMYTATIDGPMAPFQVAASAVAPAAADTGTFEDRFIGTIPPVVSTSFTGKFRAFLRCYNASTPTAGEEPASRLRIAIAGESYYTQSVKSASTSRLVQSLDMGVVYIPELEAGTDAPTVEIAVQTKFTATGVALYYVDVVLIPVDEWVAELVSPRGGAGVLTEGRTLTIKSINSTGRLSASMISDNGEYVRWRAGGKLFTPPLGETTRLWVFAISEENVDGLGINSTNISFQNTVMSLKSNYLKNYTLYSGVL